LKFIDLFGGIGGFRLGLEKASEQFECVDYIEYDKYAVKSYNAIFNEEHEPRDVTKLSKSEIPEHDLLCAGFPCQSFSVAGNRQGTDEARGKLFREIARIAEAKRPEMLLLENVKGILSQKAVKDGEAVKGTKGHAFTEVLQALHELGYCLEWQVLNSKNWGVPQNRERVFIVGHLGGEPQRKVFPI
jgi:DNA (cytosine-5)-methyltransferase 1